MPPMPPCGIIGAPFSSGLSVISASVVRIIAGDRRSVLNRRAGDLGRIDDAGGDHVHVLVGDHVVADVDVLLLG